jgi:UDP-N-acetylglucosamine 2-epimerase
LLTLHRRENLSPYRLTVLHRLIGMMDKLVVFPVHPETRKAIYESGLREKFYETENLLMTEPMEYLDFLLLEEGSHLVMTDSGGVCEEATYMEKPLIILRERTERPEPVEAGVAKMLRLDDIEFKGLEQYLEEGLKRRDDRVKFAYGVGDAAERVAEHIASTPLKAKPKIRDMREILLYQEFSLGREQPFPQVREEVERRGCQVIAALDGMGGTILEGSGKASKILVKGYKHLLETISNMGL